jgi:hypothetical protein
MGVPTSEVGYTSATTGTGDHEVHKGHMVVLEETILFLRSNERDMIKMYIGLHIKYPLCLLGFYETSILSTDFRKIFKHQIS